MDTAFLKTAFIAAINAAIAAIVQHYLGTPAAAGTVVAGTAVAHVMQSPLKK